MTSPDDDLTPIARWDKGLPPGADHVHSPGDCRHFDYLRNLDGNMTVTVRCVWCRTTVVAHEIVTGTVEETLARIALGQN